MLKNSTIQTIFKIILFLSPLVFSMATRSMVVIKGAFLEIGVWIVFILYFLRMKKFPVFDIIEKYLLLYFVILVTLTIFNQARLGMYNIYWLSIPYIFRFLTFFLLIVLYRRLFRWKSTEQILILFLIGLFFSHIYAIYQLLNQAAFREFYRDIFSFFGNPTFYAGYMVGLIPFCTAYIFISFIKHKFGKSLLFLGLFLLSSVLLILTYSKSGYLGYFIILPIQIVILIALLNKKLAVRLTIGILILLIIIFFIGKKTFPHKIKHFTQEISNITNTDLTSSKMRICAYKSAMNITRDYPIIGTGVGSFRIFLPGFRPSDYRDYYLEHNEVHVHNELLEQLSEQGIIGLGLWIFIIINILKLCYKNFQNSTSIKQKILLLTAVLSILAIYIENLFNMDLRLASTQIIFFLLLAILSGNVNAKKVYVSNSAKTIVLVLSVSLLISSSYFWYTKIYSEHIKQELTSLTRPGSRVFVDGKPSRDTKLMMIEKKYLELIKVNKYDIGSYYKLASNYFDQKKYVDCEKWYRKIQEYSPDFSQIHYNLGLLYLNQNRFILAVSEYIKAFKADSKAYTINQLAYTYQRMKKYDYAIKYYSIAAFKNPKRKRYLENLAYNYYITNQFEKAYFYYYRLYLHRPDYKDTLRNLGVLAQKLRLPKETAIEYYSKYAEYIKSNDLTEYNKIMNIISRLK